MSHSHHHHHPPEAGENRLIWALMINLLLTLVQIGGGLISGSLALVADALHNLSDAGSLGVALVARRIARRPADEHRTFGYQRAELIGALINLTTLILIGLYLIFEAVTRYFHPQPIEGWLVIYIGGFALIVDLVTALLTYALSKHSLNIRAAFLHNVADALGSVAVIVAGSLILLYGWTIADLICTLLIAAYVLYHGWSEMGQTIRILMQSTPLDIDLAELIHTLESIDGVKSVHHVHVWEIDERRRSLEAHVVIDLDSASQIEEIKRKLKHRLADRYRVFHSTLEFEFETPEKIPVCVAATLGHEPSLCGHQPANDSNPPTHPSGFRQAFFPGRRFVWMLAGLALIIGLTIHSHLLGYDPGLWLASLKNPESWPLASWIAYGMALVFMLVSFIPGNRQS